MKTLFRFAPTVLLLLASVGCLSEDKKDVKETPPAKPAVTTPNVSASNVTTAPTVAPKTDDKPAIALSDSQAALDTDSKKISYIIGLNYGSNLKKTRDMIIEDGYALDVEILLSGIRDELYGRKPRMTDQEIETEMKMINDARTGKLSKEGQAFLEANKKDPAVIVLPSGLQYKVIRTGEGAKPKATDTVSVHYRGTLIDGSEFDSSYRRGQPVEFPLNGVIPGWTEGLQQMNIGSKYMLYIPYNLGYGETGKGPIPAFATLVFEVELLAIK